MKFKKIKEIIKEGKIIVINSSNKKYQEYNKMILRKLEGEFVVECYKNNRIHYTNYLTKEVYKSFKDLIKKNNIRILDDKKKIKNSPEKQMKLNLLPYLISNYEGSIVSEYTHFKLNSRPDLIIFKNGESYIFELKSDKDNLSKIEEQITEYKKISHNIFVVLNEKHLESFLKLNIEDVNILVEYKNKAVEIYQTGYNKDVEDISFLIWSAELKKLFKGLKQDEKKVIKKDLDYFKLTNLILEERFKKQTKDIRKNHKELFQKREYEPVNKKISFFQEKMKG